MTLLHHLLIFLQFFLISPFDPVRGVMFPILTMDWANCSKNRSFLSAYFLTKSADSLFFVKRTSSELSRPLLANKFL